MTRKTTMTHFFHCLLPFSVLPQVFWLFFSTAFPPLAHYTLHQVLSESIPYPSAHKEHLQSEYDHRFLLCPRRTPKYRPPSRACLWAVASPPETAASRTESNAVFYDDADRLTAAHETQDHSRVVLLYFQQKAVLCKYLLLAETHNHPHNHLKWSPSFSELFAPAASLYFCISSARLVLSRLSANKKVKTSLNSPDVIVGLTL